MRELVGILGIPVDILNTSQTLERLEDFIRTRCFHQVVTANTDFLINSLEDPELMRVMQSADMVIPDGMPLIWASRWLGSPLPERVTGADLVPSLAALAARKGYRIYMLGAKPDVAQSAKKKLEANYPGIQIVGCVSPPIASIVEMDSQSLIDSIQLAKPDILFVAYGNPKQEKWIALHKDELRDVPVCIGVGGTFDFIAGNTKRAPIFIQKSGMEWAYRLCQEPKRLWRRYYRDITQFAKQAFQQCLIVKRSSSGHYLEIKTEKTIDTITLTLKGELCGGNVALFRKAAYEAMEERKLLVLDVLRIDRVDGAAIGTLIDLPNIAAKYGVEVRLFNIQPDIHAALKASHLFDGLYHLGTDRAEHLIAGSMPDLFEWSIATDTDRIRVELSGAANAPQINQLEQMLIDIQQNNERFEIDCANLTYVNSRLLKMLFRLSGGYSDSKSMLSILAGPVLSESLTHAGMRYVFNMTSRFEALKSTDDIRNEFAVSTPLSQTSSL